MSCSSSSAVKKDYRMGPVRAQERGEPCMGCNSGSCMKGTPHGSDDYVSGCGCTDYAKRLNKKPARADYRAQFNGDTCLCSGDGCCHGDNLKIMRYNGYPSDNCPQHEHLGSYVPSDYYTTPCLPIRSCGNSLADFSKCRKLPKPDMCMGYGLSSTFLMFPSAEDQNSKCGSCPNGKDYGYGVGKAVCDQRKMYDFHSDDCHCGYHDSK